MARSIFLWVRVAVTGVILGVLVGFFHFVILPPSTSLNSLVLFSWLHPCRYHCSKLLLGLPKLSLLQAEEAQHPQLLLIPQVFQPVIILVVFHWTCSSWLMSVWYWQISNCVQCSACGLPECCMDWCNCIPQSAGCTPVDKPLCCQLSLLQGHAGGLCVARPLQVLLWRAVPQAVSVTGEISCPRYRT